MSDLDLLIRASAKSETDYRLLRKEINSYFREPERHPLESLSKKVQRYSKNGRFINYNRSFCLINHAL